MRFFEIVSVASLELSFQFEEHSSRKYARVTAPDGRIVRILQSRFPLNLAIAARAAGDKEITKSMLQEAGLHTPSGACVNLSNDWEFAFLEFAKIGGRAIVKPSSGERGALVFDCRNSGQLAFAMSQISKAHNTAVVEEFVEGSEYRVLVLDGKPLYLLERRCFSVLSDGTSNLLELIMSKDPKILSRLLGDPRLTPMAGTPSLASVLPNGCIFIPVPAANTTSGITVSLATASEPEVIRHAVRATAALGLRYAGVDYQGQPNTESAVSACRRLLEACFAD
jgi:cyanophycin synthetase